MFQINGRQMLTNLVDFHLDRKTSPVWENNVIKRPGIIFPIKLQATSPNMKKSSYIELFALFFGNTSVCYTVTENIMMDDEISINSLDWKNTSNHDSCWRSDGLQFLTDIYFELCKEVAPDVAPIKVQTEMSLGWLSFKMIDVIVHFDHAPEGYWVNIKKLIREK